MNKKQKEVLIKLGMQNGFKLADLVGKKISFETFSPDRIQLEKSVKKKMQEKFPSIATLIAAERVEEYKRTGVLTKKFTCLITSAHEQQWYSEIGNPPYEKTISNHAIIISIWIAAYCNGGGFTSIRVMDNGIIVGSDSPVKNIKIS